MILPEILQPGDGVRFGPSEIRKFCTDCYDCPMREACINLTEVMRRRGELTGIYVVRDGRIKEYYGPEQLWAILDQNSTAGLTSP